MKLSAALQWESQREDSRSWNKLYLNKDGKFFHAYQWSAWLLKMFVCTEQLQQERGDAKMLTAQRTPTKDGEYVMAGFPIDSMGKYVPEYVNMIPVEEGNGDVIIEISFPPELDDKAYGELVQMYEEWYASCTLREPKQKTGKPVPTAVQMAGGRQGMFAILSQLLAYPVEARTPAENVEFIGLLKRQVAALL